MFLAFNGFQMMEVGPVKPLEIEVRFYYNRFVGSGFDQVGSDGVPIAFLP